MVNPDIATLRELLYDAGVLCSRLSTAVSNGELPPQCSHEVAATRGCVLAAQQCCGLLAIEFERRLAARIAGPDRTMTGSGL